MEKLSELLKKQDALMKELKQVNQQINEIRANNEEDIHDVEGIISIQKDLEQIEIDKNNANSYINQQVLEMKDSLADYEWFAYMAWSQRKIDLNEREAEIKSWKIAKASLEDQVSKQYGNYERAREILTNVELNLNSAPMFLKRAKWRVDSSYQYYRMCTGQISRMDYETLLLGNREVPIGDDENFANALQQEYINSNMNNLEEPEAKVKL